jgi:small acid-soluble spore protein D (minor alpha/beta-type SASP)
MARRRKRRLLVPEAREALERLKQSVVVEKMSGTAAPVERVENPARLAAQSVGIPYNARDNGDMKARDAGTIGGHIGGSMVKRLIEIAEQELAQETPRRP